MASNIKDQIRQAIKDQKEIFGDFLFQEDFIKNKKSLKHPNIKTSKTSTPVKKEKGENKVSEPVEKINYEPDNSPMLFDNREAWQKTENLNNLYDLIKDCQKCPLYENRNKFVFGSGNPEADVIVIGEGPGAEEDNY